MGYSHTIIRQRNKLILNYKFVNVQVRQALKARQTKQQTNTHNTGDSYLVIVLN